MTSDRAPPTRESAPPASMRWVVPPLPAWLAFALCLAPRLAIVLALGFSDYAAQAEPTMSRPNYPLSYSGIYPLYIAYASLLKLVSFSSPRVFILLGAALQSLIGPLVLSISRELKLGPSGGWLAVLGVAFLPYYVSIAGRQPQLGFTIVLVAWLLLLFLRWFAVGFSAAGTSLAIGVLGALMALLRPNVVFSVVVLYGVAISVVVVRSGARSVLAATRAVWRSRVLVSVAAFALVQGAIFASYFVRTGHPSPFTNTGYNLYASNNQYVGDYLWSHDMTSLEDTVFDHRIPAIIARTADPFEVDATFKRLALEYMRAHPGETIKNTLVKGLRYWDFRLEDADRNSFGMNLAYSVPYLLSLLLAVLGIRDLRERGLKTQLLVVLVFIFSYFLPHAIFFGTIRMRMTTEFMLVVLAAGGAVRGASLLRVKARAPSPLSAR